MYSLNKLTSICLSFAQNKEL